MFGSLATLPQALHRRWFVGIFSISQVSNLCNLFFIPHLGISPSHDVIQNDVGDKMHPCWNPVHKSNISDTSPSIFTVAVTLWCTVLRNVTIFSLAPYFGRTSHTSYSLKRTTCDLEVIHIHFEPSKRTLFTRHSCTGRYCWARVLALGILSLRLSVRTSVRHDPVRIQGQVR